MLAPPAGGAGGSVGMFDMDPAAMQQLFSMLGWMGGGRAGWEE